MATLFVAVLVLGGCAAEPGEAPPEPENISEVEDAPAAPETAEPTASPEPVTQEETCDWDAPRGDSGAAEVPASADGDLAVDIIGSWQHTHIDSGAGFEALEPTTDIRYVFPAATRLLYCQDVEGATSQAENAVDFTLDGAEIVLPSPATGYAVTAWSADTMVWLNHRDNSLYLLQRR